MMMNQYAVQQNNIASNCEEMRNSSFCFSSDERGSPVFCPKPRRLGPANHDSITPLWWHMSYQTDLDDSKAGSELLDIILPKGGYGVEQYVAPQAGDSPFFCGSPPSRVSNPLIQDARFGDEKAMPSIPFLPSGMSSSSPTSSARKGGCVQRANFGNNPGVRVEGFDCLDRDNRRNCSIPTLA